MKKAPVRKPRATASEHLREEYRFDYAKAKPNRFAGQGIHPSVVVVLDEDVSSVFSTPEAVNKALRALIAAMPRQPSSRKVATRTRRKRGA